MRLKQRARRDELDGEVAVAEMFRTDPQIDAFDLAIASIYARRA